MDTAESTLKEKQDMIKALETQVELARDDSTSVVQELEYKLESVKKKLKYSAPTPMFQGSGLQNMIPTTWQIFLVSPTWQISIVLCTITLLRIVSMFIQKMEW